MYARLKHLVIVVRSLHQPCTGKRRTLKRTCISSGRRKRSGKEKGSSSWSNTGSSTPAFVYLFPLCAFPYILVNHIGEKERHTDSLSADVDGEGSVKLVVDPVVPQSLADSWEAASDSVCRSMCERHSLRECKALASLAVYNAGS